MKKLKEHVEELCSELGLTGVPEIMVKASFICLVSEIRNDIVKKFGDEAEEYFDEIM